MLVEVVDDCDEVALATSAFEQQGWLVRPARDGEADARLPRTRTWLLLEVRFPGYPKPAVKVAVRWVDRVIDKYRIGAWIRRAEAVRFPKEQEVTYFIDETAPGWLRRVHHLTPVLRFAGVPRTTGLIRLTGTPPEGAVRARLAQLSLGQPFDPARFALRPGSVAVARDGTPAPDEQAPMSFRLLGVTGLFVALMCGMVTKWAPAGWKVIPLLIAVAMMPLARLVLPRNQPSRYRTIVAALFTTFMVGAGYEGALENRDPPSLVAYVVAVGLGLFTVRGLAFAFRDSWLARQVTWVIPIAMSVLAPFALWLGGSYDAEYLGHFGIPSSAVSVPTFFRLAIAANSALVGLAFVLMFIALFGWGRYFHWIDDSVRWEPLLLVTILCVAYAVGAVVTGLNSVNGAAVDAAARARQGRAPASYFSLHGTLECLSPVAAVVPVYNGPLPAGRPVLSFGTAGGQLWVWDPSSRRSIEIPLDDVTVIPAKGSPARCPRRAR